MSKEEIEEIKIEILKEIYTLMADSHDYSSFKCKLQSKILSMLAKK